MKLGKALREARNKTGLSQEAVAKKAAISRVYVSQLETELKRDISLEVFCKLAKALDLRPSELLSRIE